MFSEVLKEFDIDYIDGVVVYDDNGKIIYSVRYNPRYDKKYDKEEYDNIINRNMLEVYPSLKAEDSTVMNCLKYGEIIYNEHQTVKDYKGRLITTNNITIPIVKMGKVVGVVELVKDITTIDDISQVMDSSNGKNIFRNKKKNKNSSTGYSFEDIITDDFDMKRSIEKAKMIAGSDSSVLVYGETGTGKELFVQSIHNYSKRKKKPFIAQNCAALPETLFESILFGSVKGSFTGAEDKAGLFEMADGGTLFLDEVNSMPLNLQAKLLRVIQDGFLRRIGDNKNRKVDVRIITAMNIDPKEALDSDKIRKDLFYRLNVNSLKLISLKKRRNDINLLVNYFVEKYNNQLNKDIKGISKEVEMLFYLYDWPGNVRELQHIIEGAMNIAREDIIGLGSLPAYFKDVVTDIERFNENETIQPLNELVEIIEKKMINNAIKKAGGNVSKAAKYLEISRQTLQYKMKKYDIYGE
jgi:arginine utilization regulatory protein